MVLSRLGGCFAGHYGAHPQLPNPAASVHTHAALTALMDNTRTSPSAQSFDTITDVADTSATTIGVVATNALLPKWQVPEPVRHVQTADPHYFRK
ncbi:MAG: hypothetical protein KBE07_14040 [Rhodoferax sp.]|jgi:hypothetical protein|nr:hypothetical protein [Rhodoferax sp.]